MSMISSIKALSVALVMAVMVGCATVGKDFATHNDRRRQTHLDLWQVQVVCLR